MNEKWKSFAREMLVIGTPECAVFSGAAAMVLALLLLTLGFWKTLLVALIVCAGAFIGGVKDKKKCVSRVVNRLFPPKATVPYQARQEDKDRVEEMRREAEKADIEKADVVTENREEENREENNTNVGD